ncbi:MULTISPECIES: membrane protein insertion efficiency factor YidD [unclassified Roseateles]|uniref:membrane protein insertion efficiency factor YidD n=1 Tax=unclassified Roseateles TaxID=2626991 RepID=UPI0006FDE450|nr:MULTISPECIES: membrane protein insertion efficiency factor YidD [unclassified Roseateles]KQW46699.1 membrane protein insertion efficiency factor YidD [Pelomonas sp. Root405]KRA73751.1 membrane protein insertion efficiency factor YidD [Pelomonas sp. Root662]
MTPSWPARALMAVVRGYRLMLSPWLGSACRFEPTCSRYSLAALEKHGALAGSYLTVHRILRCAPWCAGGHDPVPDRVLDNAPRLFSRLISPSLARTCASSSSSESPND